MTEVDVQQIVKAIHQSFYYAWDFWINAVIGVAGVGFAWAAFLEARQAKEEAKQAGRSVKIQTVVLELTESSLKLDRVDPEIKYRDARNLLSETSRRVHRATAPFMDDEKLKKQIALVISSIEAAVQDLAQVRPITASAEEQAPHAVYNAIESHFGKINNDLASLIGLLEKQSSNFGE